MNNFPKRSPILHLDYLPRLEMPRT
jgi:hypothetical protein